MGISWAEGLGYVFQGAAEGSEKIRQEKLATRMEEMKADKALYREIAKTRYASDLSTYNEEAKKYKKVSAVLTNIKDNNISIDQATTDLINADDKLYAAYLATDEKDKSDFLANIQATYFQREDDGGYSVSYPRLGIQRPTETDYFKGPDFWKKYAEQIEEGTEGPLVTQVKKLLGKKPDAEGQLKLDMNVRGTEVYGDMDSKEYKSNNSSASLFGLSSEYYAYDLDDTSDKTRFDSVIKSFDTINSRTNKEATVARHIVALGGNAKEISFDNDKGVLTLNGNGANNFNQALSMYDIISTKVKSAIILPNSPISKKDEFANQSTVDNIFNQSVKDRTIKIKNSKIFGGGDINANFIIGEVHEQANLQIGLDKNNKVQSQFLNGDPQLLARIENAVNNNEAVQQFDGEVGAATDLVNSIIANEIELMVEEGLLKPKEKNTKDDGTTGGEPEPVTMEDVNLLMQEEKNKGKTSMEIIAGLKEKGYDVSQIEKIKEPSNTGDARLAEIDSSIPENVFALDNMPDRIIKVQQGKVKVPRENPEYRKYVESLTSEDLDLLRITIEKIMDLEPQKKVKQGRAMVITSEWKAWSEQYNPYIQLYFDTQQ